MDRLHEQLPGRGTAASGSGLGNVAAVRGAGRFGAKTAKAMIARPSAKSAYASQLIPNTR